MSLLGQGSLAASKHSRFVNDEARIIDMILNTTVYDIRTRPYLPGPDVYMFTVIVKFNLIAIMDLVSYDIVAK